MIQLLFSALPEFLSLLPMLLLTLVPSAILIGLSLALSNLTRIRRAVRALSMGCDPEPLLKLSLRTLRRYGKSRNPKHSTILFSAHINAATALYNLGRFEEALAHLDIPRLEDYPLPSQAVCLLNRAAVYCDQGRPQDMAAAMDRAQALMDRPDFPPKQRSGFDQILSSDRLAYRFLTEGPGPEVEAAYQALLPQATGQSQRVGFHLQLARCALARGANEEAREHLQYAVTFGNKLHNRRLAEELLAGLPQ